MKKDPVVLLSGFTPEQARDVQAAAPGARYLTHESRQAARSLIGEADALVGLHRAAFDEVLDDELLRAGRRLRWVHASGAGVEAYLLPALVGADIVFTNGKILQGPHVADQALALLLALTRNLQLVFRGDAAPAKPRPIELRGKKGLVVGAGGVGLLIAERLHGFGVTVSCVNDANLPLLNICSRSFMPDELPDALPEADFIIVAAPLTAASRGMFGPREFNAAKKNSIFINVSRGGLVQTDALLEALKSGKLAAAGLDVTDPEPLAADHPLRGLRNVAITPHMAGMSDANHARSFELIIRNLRRFVRNLPLVNVVDKKAGY
jgi:phosphoglycerate dehydrogenase-like enzyme